jgi:hypothetical protein
MKSIPGKRLIVFFGPARPDKEQGKLRQSPYFLSKCLRPLDKSAKAIRGSIAQNIAFREKTNELVMIDLISPLKRMFGGEAQTCTIVYCQIDCVENYSKKN